MQRFASRPSGRGSGAFRWFGKMAKWSSLRSRLMLVMAVVFALGVGNVMIYLLDLDKDIRAHVLNEQIDTLLARAAGDGEDEALDELPLQFSESSWRYSLYSADGRLLGVQPEGSEPLPLIVPRAPPPLTGDVMDARQLKDGSILVVRRNDWGECEELCQIMRGRVAGSTTALAILGIISIVAMAGLAGWMLSSVRRAAALAGTIGRDHPERRIPIDELPTEIVPLARAANDAFDRLAGAYESERRFTADAAHELRTPLAVLDLRLQKARRSAQPDWDAIAGDMRQMQHLVDQLLALARAEQANFSDELAAPVSAARLVREAVADMLPAYEAAHRAIEIEVEEGLAVPAGRDLLRQALRNLLDNAIRHGQGTVRVAVRRAGAEVEISVGDEGPAGSPEAAELLFDRFRKGRQHSAGSGLGLAIVRSICRRLGGDARAGGGPGFAVVLRLPTAGQAGDSAPVQSSPSNTSPSAMR